MNDSMNTSMHQDKMSHQNDSFSMIPRNFVPSTSSTSSSMSQKTNDSGVSMSSGQMTFAQTQFMKTSSFPFIDDVNKYKRIAKIGHGTYGEVFKACNPTTNKIVALKRVLDDNKKFGFSMTTLREIRILQQINHENVVNLIEVCRSTSSVGGYHSNFYLVFEFCEHDLAGLLSNTNVRFNLGEIKSILKQLLNGIYFVHSCKIFHRDLKPANILVTKTGVVKLADFGLSRQFNLSDKYRQATPTNQVVTLWYRSPELLLGDINYGLAIDMWSVGLIMAEMWTRSPILQGKTEQEQIYLISQFCGAITPEVWPTVTELPLYKTLHLSKDPTRKIKDRLRPYVKDFHARDLIDSLLILDPTKRFDTNAALDHDFFFVDPLPADLSKLFAKHHRSMFDLHTRQRPPNANPNRTQDGGYMDHVY
ncbi:cyclin-dependent kinase 9-like [Contarinia nasturtii]|uniref:cyclin-dependent kinase 9-like n=1 Tax=Contarinia nasturtii TaxID=265458 RepID=UPI0012D3C39E|nr:cyclin-dependent kinase 9-like [Contarinia nasturtii]